MISFRIGETILLLISLDECYFLLDFSWMVRKRTCMVALFSTVYATHVIRLDS